MTVPFVHSQYKRIENDDYQTMDPRCIRALCDSVFISKEELIIDCCSPSGSGIVSELKRTGYIAEGLPDAFREFTCDWNIFNPPYTRGLVDDII